MLLEKYSKRENLSPLDSKDAGLKKGKKQEAEGGVPY
jgi:hypothetical protein